jgi:hypothetical protein
MTLPLQANAEFDNSPISWAEIASIWSTRSTTSADPSDDAANAAAELTADEAADVAPPSRPRTKGPGRQPLSKVVGLRPDVAPAPAPRGEKPS